MTTWHVPEDVLDGYADGRISPAVAASTEAHLLSCARCRAVLAPAVDTSRLERIWDEVVQRVDAPRPGPVEALLLRLGLRNDSARLLAATPSLRLSWLAGVSVALLLALLAAQSGERGVAVFLALAPILPVAGVALAFGPQTDPTYELATAAPYSSFRLLLLRSIAVMSTTLPLAGAGAALLPGAPWLAVAWLLPALALATLTIAVATYVDIVWAACGLSAAWLSAVLSGFAAGNDPLLAFRAGAQITCLVAALAGAVVVAVRRNSFTTLGRSA